MLQSFPAIYENGVLKPLIPLSLAEHEHVWVQVSPQSARLEKASDVIEMQRRAAEELDAAMDALPDNSPADGFTAADHDRILYGKSE